jgi:hypothetical protein
MPRTIDHILDCHHAAQERRNRGQDPWDRRINIKTVLHRDPDNIENAYAASVGREIADLLRLRTPVSWREIRSDDFDWDLDEILDFLSSLKGDNQPENSVVEELNQILDMLYDWADRKRIWLG